MVAHFYATDNQPGLNPDELKSRIDFREFVAGDMVKPRRSREALTGRSPLRAERKSSFAAYADGWKDFGTGESGDIFDYVMRRENVDFTTALRLVREWAGDPTTRPTYTPPASVTTIVVKQSAEWRAAAQAVLEMAQRRLKNTPRVMAYLRDLRHLTDETIDANGLGYLPEWAVTSYHKEDGKFAFVAPGIMIPTYDAEGQLCGLRVRTITGSFAAFMGRPDAISYDGEPLAKYLNMAGSRRAGWMMNADKVTSGCTVLMVEGEFDAILASQELTGVVVVTLGAASNHLTAEQAAILHNAASVFSALDNDKAGQAATTDASTKLDNLTVLHLPKGKDVTEYVQAGGDLAEWWATTQRFSWCPDGLYNSIRSALLRYFPKTVAQTLEMLNDAGRRGLLDLTCFTMPEAKKANVALGEKCSPASIERVIKGYPDIFGGFSSKLETGIRGLHISNPDENPPGGRPAKQYAACGLSELRRIIAAHALPRIVEDQHPIGYSEAILAQFTADMLADATAGEDAAAVVAELGDTLKDAYRQQGHVEQEATRKAKRQYAALLRSFSDPTSTPLPDGWTDYTAAYFHVHPGTQDGMSRADIRRTFGVANGTIKTLTERAGLKPVERYELRILSATQPLEQQVREGRREQDWKAYPKRIVYSTRQGEKDSRPYEPLDPDGMQSFVDERFAAGDSVAIEYQLANTFEVVRETPPERKERAATDPAPRTEPKIELEPSAPAEPRHYGPTYNPAWIRAQLVYALNLLGRIHNSEYITPDGELAPIPDTIPALIEAVLGRNLRTGDDLIDFARAEWGAVIDYGYQHHRTA